MKKEKVLRMQAGYGLEGQESGALGQQDEAGRARGLAQRLNLTIGLKL